MLVRSVAESLPSPVACSSIELNHSGPVVMNIYSNYWKVDSSNPKPKYLMENVSRLFDVKMELGFEKTKNT